VEINENTKIRLYAVLGAMPVLVGGIIWVTMIFFKADAAERINAKQDEKLDSQMIILLDIRDRVSRIEERTLNRKDN
jgi:hypothetical protein